METADKANIETCVKISDSLFVASVVESPTQRKLKLIKHNSSKLDFTNLLDIKYSNRLLLKYCPAKQLLAVCQSKLLTMYKLNTNAGSVEKKCELKFPADKDIVDVINLIILLQKLLIQLDKDLIQFTGR